MPPTRRPRATRARHDPDRGRRPFRRPACTALAGIERARLRGVVSHAARDGPDAIVVGAASPASGALEVIGELKRHPQRRLRFPCCTWCRRASACGACGADICLAADARRLDARERRAPAAAAARGRAQPRRRGDRRAPAGARAPRRRRRARLQQPAAGDDGPRRAHAAAAGRRPPRRPRASCRCCTLPRGPLRSPGSCSRSAAPHPTPRRFADVGAVLAQLEPMLRRLLGAYVRLEVRAGRGLGPVRADPSQVEQLLLNLVLNARDAMPAGGRLTIETQDVEVAGGTAPPAPPGRYVMLAVSDEGVGMDAETRARIFEPFFTTKPAGEGSGLGLATVQQVVERAGGHGGGGQRAGARHHVPRLPALRGGAPAARGARRRRSRSPGPRDGAGGRRLGAGARDHARAARGPRLPGADRRERRGDAAARTRVGRADRRGARGRGDAGRAGTKPRRAAPGAAAAHARAARVGHRRRARCRSPSRGASWRAPCARPSTGRTKRLASWFRLPRGMAKRGSGPGRRGFLRRLGASVAATLAVPGAASSQARKPARAAASRRPRRSRKAAPAKPAGARPRARSSARARARPRGARRLAAARARRAHRPRPGALDLAARRAHARQHASCCFGASSSSPRRPSPRAAS